MFFLAPPMVVVVQTGLPIVVGMQSLILAPLILASERMGFRTEPERDRLSILDQSGAQEDLYCRVMADRKP